MNVFYIFINSNQHVCDDLLLYVNKLSYEFNTIRTFCFNFYFQYVVRRVFLCYLLFL